MAHDEIPKDTCANLNCRMPSAGNHRVDKSLRPCAAKAASNSICRVSRALLENPAGLRWPCFNGKVAIRAGSEARTKANRKAREPAQVGRDLILLHSRIDKNVERAKDHQIQETKLRDDHIFGGAKAREDLKTHIDAPGGDARDCDRIVEEGVVEGHFPPDHGR